MPVNSKVEELARKARFVFKGTVQKLKAATMTEVPVTDRTVIVRVDEVIQASEALFDYAGQDITVQLGGRRKVKKGDQAVFYTNGWIFGDGLAVQSLAQHPVKKTGATLAAPGGDPVENLTNKDMEVRFESADVVVSGRVTSVRLPPDTLLPGASAAASGAGPITTKPISEHDPLIQEAVVEVDAVHKGTHDKKEVVVRFPSSTDVKWYKAPKFRPGQQGFFMLHKGETKDSAGAKGAGLVAAVVREGEAEGAHTALHPADFQSFDRPGGVRNLITVAGPAAPLDDD